MIDLSTETPVMFSKSQWSFTHILAILVRHGALPYLMVYILHCTEYRVEISLAQSGAVNNVDRLWSTSSVLPTTYIVHR